MFYFSELKGKRVVTQQGAVLGRLTDLVFLAQNQPFVTKLAVRDRESHTHLIPVSYLKKLNSHISIQDEFTVEPLAAEELYITKNILDQQIIDIKGNKVVRVNDVAIHDKPQMIVAGVDIGIVGLLRWFGIDETFGRLLRLLGRTVQSRFLSWADIQPLELVRGKVVLRKEEAKLTQLLPEDLADHLEKMSLRNITRVLTIMDDHLAAEVIESLNVTYQQSLFKQFAPERASKLISRMDPDEAVDILLTLTEKRRTQIMGFLPTEKHKELTRLLSLSKTPIGGLITSEFFTAAPEETVLTIRRRIRAQTHGFSSLSYVYAVNKQQQLVGVVNLHELLMQKSDTPLFKCMNPTLVVIYLTTPVEIAIKRLLKFKLEALPVIDDKKNILGIVTFDDLTESILHKL